MRQSAAVLSHDDRSLRTLEGTLEQLGIEFMNCRSEQHALESIMTGNCSTLIVDFDLPGAREVMRMADLLPEAQKPNLLAVSSRAWPGTGEAFQSGAGRILYKPLDAELARESLRPRPKSAGASSRRSARYEVKTLVYLEIEGGTVPAISIDIGEHGLALQATDPLPMSSNLPFHCVLPGTKVTLHGHADVIWASDQGRAGLFFSKLAPSARKHLKNWLHKRSKHQKDKNEMRDLLPAKDDHVAFAACEDEA
jgi:ActR/RegA family two-component response regulator